MKGFVSYAHADLDMVEDFRRHLKAVDRAVGLEPWIDHEILAGTVWEAHIAAAIAAAEVFVLLISPEFIYSDYVCASEIPAIQCRRTTGALVLPVVLKSCSWQYIAGPLQAVPTANGRLRPIDAWPRHNDGYNCARQQMERSISAHFGIVPRAIAW